MAHDLDLWRYKETLPSTHLCGIVLVGCGFLLFMQVGKGSFSLLSVKIECRGMCRRVLDIVLHMLVLYTSEAIEA